jgi:hypothetical protein
VSSISVISRIRTCSTISINYIEMREGMGQSGQQSLHLSEKVWKVG